jgi:hypothetical protein
VTSTVGGGILIAVGLLGLYGAATGRLTPMIAALFYPQLLIEAQSGS